MIATLAFLVLQTAMQAPAPQVGGADGQDLPRKFADLTIDDLLRLEVTSVSKKEQPYRITVSGKDAAGNNVTGSNTVTVSCPAASTGAPGTQQHSIPVTVTNETTRARATKWFIFVVTTMC